MAQTHVHTYKDAEFLLSASEVWVRTARTRNGNRQATRKARDRWKKATRTRI